MEPRQSSHWVPVGAAGDALHLRRVVLDEQGPGVLALHGAVENGRVFYSPTGRGLAPFLARRGFDVWVGDLRGRGGSRPHVGRGARWGQTEAITEDLPALLDAVAAVRGREPELWVAHSWGGVLMSSHLLRFPERLSSVRRLAYFGTKRRVLVRNRQRRIQVDLFWKGLGFAATALFGYLPARRLGWGSDDESRRSHADSVAWVRERGAWVDSADGFDYGEAARRLRLPPTLYLAGAADPCLGHPDDVRRFVAESGEHEAAVVLLARAAGRARDYGHVDMLTHPGAPADHFPTVAAWLEGAAARPGLSSPDAFASLGA